MSYYICTEHNDNTAGLIDCPDCKIKELKAKLEAVEKENRTLKTFIIKDLPKEIGKVIEDNFMDLIDKHREGK